MIGMILIGIVCLLLGFTVGLMVAGVHKERGEVWEE